MPGLRVAVEWLRSADRLGRATGNRQPQSRSTLTTWATNRRIAHRPNVVFARRRGHGLYPQRVATFALVHGAWHGSWCWELLTPFLRQAGHGVVAPELPSDDGSANFDTYADVMCSALQGCDDEVIVVGHSLGGPAATLVAARRPVRHLIYLCAVVPECGLSQLDQFQAQPDMITPKYVNGYVNGLSEPDEQGRTVWVDFDFVREMFYADCDERTVAAAIDHLRPQAAYPWTLPFSLTKSPSVPRTYVVCTEDQIITPEWSRRTARNIGADIVELPGVIHRSFHDHKRLLTSCCA